jgi:hypothetical protein
MQALFVPGPNSCAPCCVEKGDERFLDETPGPDERRAADSATGLVPRHAPPASRRTASPTAAEHAAKYGELTEVRHRVRLSKSSVIYPCQHATSEKNALFPIVYRRC